MTERHPAFAPLRIASLALLFAAVIFLWSVVLSPVWQGDPFVVKSAGKTSVMDFVIFYEAGALAASPDRLKIYDAATQLKWINRLIAPEHLDRPFFNQYPPYFFVLMAPLSGLPMKSAYVLWSLAWPLIAAAALNLVLIKFSPNFSGFDRLMFILWFAASAPFMVSIKLGQTSFWFFTCICLLICRAALKRERVAAIFLVLSTIKPQYVIFLGLPAVVRKRINLLATAFVAEAALLIATGLIVGWHSIVGYPSWLKYVETGADAASVVSAASMVNVRGLFAALLPEAADKAIGVVALVISLLYLIRVWRSDLFSDDCRWPIALTLVFACTTSPHVHYHDLILLGIAAALTLPSLSLRQAARCPDGALRMWWIALLFYPVVSWLCYISRNDTVVPVLSLINSGLMISGIIHVERQLALCSTSAQEATSEVSG